MEIQENVTACLRAQDHGHPPVICFEPGIAKREGSDSRFVLDKSVTLRAQMGDNQPAVCFEERAGRDGGGKGILIHDDMSGAVRSCYISNVCYAVDSHPMDSRFEIAGDISPTVTSKLLKGSADGPLELIEK